MFRKRSRLSAGACPRIVTVDDASAVLFSLGLSPVQIDDLILPIVTGNGTSFSSQKRGWQGSCGFFLVSRTPLCFLFACSECAQLAPGNVLCVCGLKPSHYGHTRERIILKTWIVQISPVLVTVFIFLCWLTKPKLLGVIRSLCNYLALSAKTLTSQASSKEWEAQGLSGPSLSGKKNLSGSNWLPHWPSDWTWSPTHCILCQISSSSWSPLAWMALL